MSRFRAFRSMIIFFGIMMSTTFVLAQQHYVRPTEGVLLPSPSLTEVNDATSIATNPANIGFQDSWSFTYIGAWAESSAYLTGQGHGLFLAFPAGPFGLGIATEFLLPPAGIRSWQGMDKRGRLSLGMSVNPMRSIGLGLAYRTSLNYDWGKSINSLDLAMTVRPIDYLSVAFTFADINTPEVTYSSVEHLGNYIPSRTERAPRRFNVGLTVRPAGNDRLALGTELEYMHGTRQAYDLDSSVFFDETFYQTNFKGFLDFMPVDGLSLRYRFVAEGLRNSSIPNNYYMDFALTINSKRFPFGITASPYFKVHPGNDTGFEGMSWAVNFSGDEPPSIPILLSPAYIVPIKLDKKMNSYKKAELMALFERIEEDKSVNMVLLEPESGVLTLSDAIEIRRQIRTLQRKGIKATCYLTEADAAAYIACSAASQIWINPAGGIRLAGLSAKAVYIKDLMDKVGVKADIIKIGDYKSAPEAFTQTEPSDFANEAMFRFMNSAYGKLIHTISVDRNFKTTADAKETIETGPFIAKQALLAGLVDRVVPLDLLNQTLEAYSAMPVFIDKNYAEIPLRHRTYLDSPAVAVLHIEGEIVDGHSRSIPLLGIRTTGAKTLTEQIRKIKEDTSIKAVVVRINSPGGSAVGSDIIWRELMSLRMTKPVIASMGAVAASGAYLIASAANIIFAEATSLTGSIGIFYGKADISSLLSRLGINTTVYKYGDFADMDSWTRPYSEEERAKIKEQLQEYYNLFLERIVEGRVNGLTVQRLQSRAQGRIWSGLDAREQLLVDRIGGYTEALNYARGLGFVGKGTKVFHYPSEKTSILERLVSSASAKSQSITQELLLTGETREILKNLWPLSLTKAHSPRARLPFVFLDIQ